MRKVYPIFMVICLGILICACGPAAQKENGSDKGGDKITENETGNETKAIGIKTEEESEDGLKMAYFTGVAPYYLKKAVSNYNGSHPDERLSFANEDFAQESDRWTRMLAELSAGEGPDMICMSGGDERIKTLKEKGLLANLDDYIASDVKNWIFPGIIETGSVDGTWVGLGVEGMPWVFLVADDVWQGEQWSLSDVISLAKERPEMQGLFMNYQLSNFGEGGAEVDERFLLDYLDVFIDDKEGKGDFSNAEFIDALKLLKASKNATIPEKDLYNYLKNGNCLGVFTRMVTTKSYQEVMREYCTNRCHFVGLVGQKEGVGEWTGVWLILVNARTKHPERVREFLDSLLEYENQGGNNMALSVREDVIRGKVKEADWEVPNPEERWLYALGKEDGWGYAYVPFADPSGESYLERYLDFLSKLGPCRESREDSVKRIVTEEVESYLGSDKSAEETAKLIENRIHLLLAE